MRSDVFVNEVGRADLSWVPRARAQTCHRATRVTPPELLPIRRFRSLERLQPFLRRVKVVVSRALLRRRFALSPLR
jgi:hypothetical protein